jgi:hypothetical protein
LNSIRRFTQLPEFFSLMDARGLIGRDNATSDKREDRFYVMKGEEAKGKHSDLGRSSSICLNRSASAWRRTFLPTQPVAVPTYPRDPAVHLLMMTDH